MKEAIKKSAASEGSLIAAPRSNLVKNLEGYSAVTSVTS